MAKIAIIANTCKSRSAYLANIRLPTFYMEDFSLLGLLVEEYQAACSLLKAGGYSVIATGGGSDLHLDQVKELQTVITTLRRHGISTELADIADTLYQA